MQWNRHLCKQVQQHSWLSQGAQWPIKTIIVQFIRVLNMLSLKIAGLWILANKIPKRPQLKEIYPTPRRPSWLGKWPKIVCDHDDLIIANIKSYKANQNITGECRMHTRNLCERRSIMEEQGKKLSISQLSGIYNTHYFVVSESGGWADMSLLITLSRSRSESWPLMGIRVTGWCLNDSGWKLPESGIICQEW